VLTSQWNDATGWKNEKGKKREDAGYKQLAMWSNCYYLPSSVSAEEHAVTL